MCEGAACECGVCEGIVCEGAACECGVCEGILSACKGWVGLGCTY